MHGKWLAQRHPPLDEAHIELHRARRSERQQIPVDLHGELVAMQARAVGLHDIRCEHGLHRRGWPPCLECCAACGWALHVPFKVALPRE